MQSAAEAMPGARLPPRLVSRDPSAGPTTAPKLVTADNHPIALVRSFGSVASATYAWTTAIVPPPKPWTTRETSSITIDVAKPKTTYAAAEIHSPARIAGRRPRASENFPHKG